MSAEDGSSSVDGVVAAHNCVFEFLEICEDWCCCGILKTLFVLVLVCCNKTFEYMKVNRVFWFERVEIENLDE